MQIRIFIDIRVLWEYEIIIGCSLKMAGWLAIV